MENILNETNTEIIPLNALNPLNAPAFIDNDFIQTVNKEVEEATIYQRIFQLTGNSKIIYELLRKRGWLEYIPNTNVPNGINPRRFSQSISLFFQQIPIKLASESKVKYLQRCTNLLRTCLIHSKNISFHIFTEKPSIESYLKLSEETYTNYIIKSPFYTELCMLQKKIDEHESFFPRSYSTSYYDQWKAFIKNFRMTACISFLRSFIKTAFEDGPDKLQSTFGLVPWYNLTFAMEQCQNYVMNNSESNSDHTEQVWIRFLKNHYLFVHAQKRFIKTKGIDIMEKLDEAKQIIALISKIWPQYNTDGTKNLWIIKSVTHPTLPPKTVTKYSDIVSIIGSETYKNGNHLTIQKVIENTLLVEEKKFQICQWFLVTSVDPLLIWMYRDFCVQILENSGGDDCKGSIWKSNTFLSYLSSLHKADVWYGLVYPNMREAIKEIMVASLPNMTHRERSFELFEARFVLSVNCKPWLVDIRTITEVDFHNLKESNIIETLYTKCLDDILKVVFDRIHNPIADTGQFDLIYRHYMPKSPTEEITVPPSTPVSAPQPRPISKGVEHPKYEILPLQSIYQKYVVRNATPALSYMDEKSKKPHPKCVVLRRTPERTSFQKGSHFKYFSKINHYIIKPDKDIEKLLQFRIERKRNAGKDITLVYVNKGINIDLARIAQASSIEKTKKSNKKHSQFKIKIPPTIQKKIIVRKRKPKVKNTIDDLIAAQLWPSIPTIKIEINRSIVENKQTELDLPKINFGKHTLGAIPESLNSRTLRFPEKFNNVPNSQFVKDYLMKGYNLEWGNIPKALQWKNRIEKLNQMKVQ